jgi:hypothetical protein
MELDLPDDLAAALERTAREDRRTTHDYIVLTLGDLMFGHSRHLPAPTPEELALYRREKRPLREIVNAKTRNSIFDRDNGKCAYCQGQILYDESWHIDHIVPVAKGGTNELSNLTLSCVACNLKKGAK